MNKSICSRNYVLPDKNQIYSSEIRKYEVEKTVFFTDSQDRLEPLKPLKDATTEDIGRFLGYPEKAIEEFEASNNSVGEKYLQKIL